jgi:hypothetical protein
MISFVGGSEQSPLDLAAQHPWYFFIPLEAGASSAKGNQKIPIQITSDRDDSSAESERFELSVPCGTLVFKTSAIDHSANSPLQM